MGHYDYWSNKVKRSILLDSQADLLLYGMGEHSIVEVAEALESGISIKDITFVNGTVYKTKTLEGVYDAVMLPSFTEISSARSKCICLSSLFRNTIMIYHRIHISARN